MVKYVKRRYKNSKIKSLQKECYHLKAYLCFFNYFIYTFSAACYTELNKRKTVFNTFKIIWKVTVVVYFKILTFLKEMRQTKCLGIKKIICKNQYAESCIRTTHRHCAPSYRI